jgi:acyl-CoA synthetase (AMP-forming)/AMP-acid ligase II
MIPDALHLPGPGRASFADVFGERVARHPDQPALTIHQWSTPGDPGQTLTYAQLARRARRRARELSTRLRPGDRVLIALPTSAEFVEVYLACLLTGLVAVPVPPPSGHAAARIAAIVADCEPGLFLVMPGDLSTLADYRSRVTNMPPVEAVESFPGGDDDPARPSGPAGPELGGSRPGSDTLAVLQYSSGSTGTPKGVMLSQGNILANATAAALACGAGPTDRIGGWIPLHHDMGLFFHLSTSLLHGARCVIMPPGDFVKRPVEWLRMLSLHRMAVSAAPNFAYDLCLRAITDAQMEGLDLSALRFLGNGSEPVHSPTMAAFTRRFARAGLSPRAISPGYGLAEATVFVSACAPGREPTVLTADPVAAEHGEIRVAAAGKPLVGLGRIDAFDARIVDPQSRAELPDGQVGELWLRGPSVGLGYWDQPEHSAATFQAVLRGEQGDEAVCEARADPAASAAGQGHATETGLGPAGWLRTGDLGTLIGGELFLVGRLKEVLVLRGRNLFPQDIEQEARNAHEALTGFFGAAFSVAAPDERIVLVHEVSPKTRPVDLPTIALTVQRSLTASLGVPLRNTLLVRRGSVRRTTSGKIQRAVMRDRFLAGELTVVYGRLEPSVQELVSAHAYADCAR